MLLVLFSTVFALFLIYVLHSCWCLYRNVTAAKAVGVPYIVLPWDNLNLPWLIARPFLLPYLTKLPFADSLWFALLSVDWPWQQQYTIFQRLGSDNFMTVSPAKNYFLTADAAVIDQITRRRNDFPKPIEVYGSLDLYGKNVVSTEGNLWKHHRKTVSPPFNEKNNRMVWYETIRQAQSMVKGWMGDQTQSSPTVSTIAQDCMRLSLHVISHAGFGVHLNWPAVKKSEGEQKLANGHLTTADEEDHQEYRFAPDHTMSYTDALHSLLNNMIWMLVLPRSLLKLLPFKRTRRAYDSYVEWGKYLSELFMNKRDDIAAGDAKQDGMDLMGFLLKRSGTARESSLDNQAQSKPALSDTEIMGNAFVFLLAGHETAANSIHFSCLYLALHPASQRRFQISLDRAFGSRPVSDWDYDRDFNTLFSGMTGAVLAEQLRLIPPVPAIPKCVLSDSSPQPVVIDGKKLYIPPATYVSLIATAVHRNPNLWPTGPPLDVEKPVHPTSNTDNDLEEFKPERWLLRDDSKGPGATSEADALTTEHTEDAPNTATGTNVSHALHRPPRGAYIPFSEGYRACLGRRFAQVEVLAALAVIFKHYSVELDVSEYGTDEELEGISAAGRKNFWDKAAGDARTLLREKMGMIFTMQLREGKVPVSEAHLAEGKEQTPPQSTMPDIDPAALSRSDPAPTLNPGSLSLSKANGVSIPSSTKAQKTTTAAQRIDLEPLYTNLKAAIGDHWGKYKDAISLFILGHLNQNELSLQINHYVCAGPNTEHLHNQLIAAIYGNVLRDVPDQGVAPWVSANDKPTLLSKPLAGDEQEQLLKRHVMHLPARDRRRLKDVPPDGQNTDPLEMSIARSAHDYHSARQIKLPEAVPPSAGSQVKTNWDLEIRKRYLPPLSSETFEFPSAHDVHNRMIPICYEESIPNGCASDCAEFVAVALEHYMKAVVSNIVGRVRSDLPHVNSVGGGVIVTSAGAISNRIGGEKGLVKTKKETETKGVELGVADMRVAIQVAGWGELAPMPTVVEGIMNDWNEGVLEGWVYSDGDEEDEDERQQPEDEMQKGGKRPAMKPMTNGIVSNGYDVHMDDAGAGGEDEEESWGWVGGGASDRRALGAALDECLSYGQ
ncbi:MAG: hypothetical protein Q9203_003969 [Teloschistes exilis]